MPYQIPKKVWIYRMIHYTNLEYILQNGFQCATSPLANPNYIAIGDSGLIQDRNTYKVPIIPPNSDLGIYIPFYFGMRSPMLLCIKTGYKGVKKYPQEDIIYLCCDVQQVVNSGVEWCFTDGQAKRTTTKFFNNLDDLDKVDWLTVYAEQWKDTDEDYDKMRRKQAEFLVKESLSAGVISNIVVYNERGLQKIEKIVQTLAPSVKVRINLKDTNNKNFYY
jgi:hypothetical protein